MVDKNKRILIKKKKLVWNVSHKLSKGCQASWVPIPNIMQKFSCCGSKPLLTILLENNQNLGYLDTNINALVGFYLLGIKLGFLPTY